MYKVKPYYCKRYNSKQGNSELTISVLDRSSLNPIDVLVFPAPLEGNHMSTNMAPASRFKHQNSFVNAYDKK